HEKRHVHSEVTTSEWTALALTTNGRMTYCQLGEDGWMHSMADFQGEHVATPENLQCLHWFIQSCHCPFAWPPYGEYKSVPVSLITNGDAKSVICSAHAQTYIPDILKLYLDCIQQGMCVGQVVQCLNRYCRLWGVDGEPFILLGHPGTRVIDTQSATTRVNATVHNSETISLSQSHPLTLSSIAANLSYLLYEPHFQFHEKLEDVKEERNDHGGSATKDYETHLRSVVEKSERLINLVNQRCIHLRSTTSPLSSPSQVLPFWNQHLSTNVAHEFSRLEDGVKGIFSAFPAYCHHLGDRSEHSYLPEQAMSDGTACPSCGVHVVRRLSNYGAAFPVPDYLQRENWICPRCFMVRDANRLTSDRIVASTEESGRSLRFSIRYQNASKRLQWIWGFPIIAECQNYAARCSPNIYRKLVSSVPLQKTSDWSGRLVEPGEVVEFKGQVEPLPEEVFYFQIECHLFIDFCWNWLCFTHLGKGMHKFIQCSEYRRQFQRMTTR
ncbi:MAG: hypothetical protein AABP62_31100, partial [Planctomycetota bacterium]